MYRVLFKLFCVLAVSLLMVEGLVRGVLFLGWFETHAALDPLRKPSSYGEVWEDEYWHLRHALGRSPAVDPERVDAELGWVPPGVKPGVYDHRDRALLDGRRPVLLFGDSFSEGMTPERFLFQSLMERSDAGERLVLINYGSKGYGFDQAVLLMQRALPHFRGTDPIVLMGVLLDDDFERALLEIRTHPKPRFRLSSNPRDPAGLALERATVPTVAEYLERESLTFVPWSLRLLGSVEVGSTVRAEGLPGTSRAHDRTCRDIAERLVCLAADHLERQDLDFGFVLFHTAQSLEDPKRLGWREPAIVELLEERGISYTLSREALARDMAATGQGAAQYFYAQGMQKNHLNKQGNRAVFEGMLELVEELEQR